MSFLRNKTAAGGAIQKKDNTLPVISIILDKPSCCYQKNELVTGSVKISNIKRKVNNLSIFIKGSYIPSNDPKIHRVYPDVARLTESVIYEQENTVASNVEIKGILKKRFTFKLHRSSNKDFPENYNGELYKMKYEVRAKGTIDDSNEGVANIEFLLRNYVPDFFFPIKNKISSQKQCLRLRDLWILLLNLATVGVCRPKVRMGVVR
jgi:hypothetical protein